MDKAELQALLQRDDFIGGELELLEEGYTFRGPIKAIEFAGNLVIFKLFWMAAKRTETSWLLQEVGDNHPLFALDMVRECRIEGKRVYLDINYIGEMRLYPKDDENQLNPNLVEGLNLAQPKPIKNRVL